MRHSLQSPQRLEAHESVIGTDTTIRRALPHRERRMIGAWCFLDHAGPVQFAEGHGLHVGPHPHIGLQTFTWMIEGEIMHRDSLGYEQIIRPGQVNLMTAGDGISHSEDSARDGGRLHAAQLWIALPDAERHCEPAFQNYTELPVVEADGWRVTVLAGTALHRTSPVQIYSPLVGIDVTAEEAATTMLPLDKAFEYGVLVLRGSATIGGETLGPGELLYFEPGCTELELRCEEETQILLVGGQPFGEDVLLWWNFVGRSTDEMQVALDDWHAGRRFGGVAPGSLAEPLKAPSLKGVNLKADDRFRRRKR